jgi:large subunit ribosomal protein L24
MRVKREDNVLVISGKDRGKKGKIRKALPKENRIIIEGVNMIKRHARARGQARQAGIIEREAPIDASDVMLICNKCNKPARVGYRILDDGKKVRVCRICKEVID